MWPLEEQKLTKIRPHASGHHENNPFTEKTSLTIIVKLFNRSSWTDTPDDKAKKAAGIVKEEDTDEAIRRDARSRLINNRDVEQELAIK